MARKTGALRPIVGPINPSPDIADDRQAISAHAAAASTNSEAMMKLRSRGSG